MPDSARILASLGLERLLDADSATPGTRVYASPEMIRGLHHVLERERSGAWRSVMKTVGYASGQKFGADLDARLTARSQPILSGLPLEAGLELIAAQFTQLGWGRLQIDLTHAAQHGLVVAHLEHSAFVELLPEVPDFVDALPAGMLQGFFEHISGQTLGCEEIACGRRGAPHCTFVITAPDRLARIMPSIGREGVDALLARLRT